MVAELNTSKLGNQDYWENVYKNEVENYKTTGEEGEVWFGEEPVMKMVQWVEDTMPLECSILDIGCGNGHLLFELVNGINQGRTGLSKPARC